ncbi:MAG: hypothetical protein MJZ93_03955 [Paludibacteraceae bacterium]|nr:hypothetical protein [Paludibacteraceae bacterium]
MNKVLIIGPNYFGYTNSISKAFVNLGWNTEIVDFDNPVHPFKGINKIRFKLANDKDAFKLKNRKGWQPVIRAKFDSIKPNLVFVLNGDMLLKDTLDYFRTKGAKVIIWMYDNISRFPHCIDNIEHCDIFACFDKEDAARVGGIFLPQASDATTYFKITNCPKDIDILFVGLCWGYKARKELLTKVIKKYQNTKKIEIYGIWSYFSKDPISCLTRPYKHIIHNHSISTEAVNQLYNRAKVVINILHEEQKNGANPKVFEISRSGAYQICTKNEYIQSVYPNGEIGLFETEQELFDLIDNALEYGYNGNMAYDIVSARHTFDERIEYILSLL